MINYYSGKNLSVAKAMASAFILLMAMQAGAQQQYCQTSRGNVGNGYHYEMWIQNGTSGSACLTVYGTDARFRTEWNLGGYGFVSRVGLLFNQTQTAEEIGWITSDYAFTKSGNGRAWMGIYGWTVNPLKEYYIIEDWNGSRPQFDYQGTITVDGGDYDVYTDMRINQPSIQGTATFEQWFSIRQTPRQSGHISISEHFEHWLRLGMQEGNLYEAKLKVEGFGGSGTVDFSAATVEVGVRPVPTMSRTSEGQWILLERTPGGQWAFLENAVERGLLSLISITGSVVMSMRLKGSEPALVSTDDLPAGMYFLRFQAEGMVPVTRPLLLD